MQEEKELPQVEEETPVEEETTEEVVEETEETEEETQEEESVTISKTKFSAMQKKAIAYDAKKKVTPKPADTNINNSIDANELKLIAKGLSDDEIEQAKVISKGKEISLMEAIEDPLFVTFQTDLKAKERKQKAHLGASTGSGGRKADTGFTSGMTDEEHKKKFAERISK